MLKHAFAVFLIFLGGFVMVQEGRKLVFVGADETTAETVLLQAPTEVPLRTHK